MAQDPADTWVVYFSNLRKGMLMTTVCQNLREWIYGDEHRTMDFAGTDFDEKKWGAGKIEADKRTKRHFTLETKDAIQARMRTGATFYVGRNTPVTIVCVHVCDVIVP